MPVKTVFGFHTECLRNFLSCNNDDELSVKPDIDYLTDAKKSCGSKERGKGITYEFLYFRSAYRTSGRHVHMTKEYEYLKEMRKVIKGDAGSYGTPTGNFINIGAIMPYMNYTPRTLDEIIAGDEAF